jgi:hypothetical protein
MKILPFGAELFHADRQIDITKLIVAFRIFSNAFKMGAYSAIITQTHSVVKCGVATGCAYNYTGFEGVQTYSLIFRREIRIWACRQW